MPLDSQVIATQVQDCLIVTIGSELSDLVLDDLRHTALDRLKENGQRAMVLDLSALRFIDAHEFERLKAIADMARMLGARTIFAGMRPGIIAYLMNADVDTRRIEGAPGLNEAMERLAIRFTAK